MLLLKLDWATIILCRE